MGSGPIFTVTPSRLTWSFIALFALALACRLSNAPIWYKDECLSAERAREFLVTGDPWVVRENFRPDFHKPPLHYWLTASTLRLLGEGKLAIRFWTAVFAVGTLALTAAYARLVAPDLPYAPLLATVFVGLCGPFVEYAQVGILDMGQIFWTMGVLVFAERASRAERGGDSRWWLAAGLCAGLGSLYKVPLPFAVWIVWLAVRLRHGPTRAELRRSRWIWAGLTLAVGLTIAWPLLQIERYGWDWWAVYVAGGVKDLVARPEAAGPWGLASYPVWILSKWGGFGVVALAGMVWALRTGWDRAGSDEPLCVTPSPARLFETALIAAISLLAISLVQSRSQRYLLPILPPLAVLGSVFFLQWSIASKRWRAAWIAVGLVPVLAIFWPHYIKHPAFDLTPRIALARQFAESARTTTSARLVSVDEVLPVPLLLYFGKLDRRVRKVSAHHAATMTGLVQGLISAERWPAFEQKAIGVIQIPSNDLRIVEFRRGPP